MTAMSYAIPIQPWFQASLYSVTAHFSDRQCIAPTLRETSDLRDRRCRNLVSLEDRDNILRAVDDLRSGRVGAMTQSVLERLALLRCCDRAGHREKLGDSRSAGYEVLAQLAQRHREIVGSSQTLSPPATPAVNRYSSAPVRAYHQSPPPPLHAQQYLPSPPGSPSPPGRPAVNGYYAAFHTYEPAQAHNQSFLPSTSGMPVNNLYHTSAYAPQTAEVPDQRFLRSHAQSSDPEAASRTFAALHVQLFVPHIPRPEDEVVHITDFIPRDYAQTGWIYAYTWPNTAPGFIKIGYTSKTPESRMLDQWYNCQPGSTIVHQVRVAFPRRVEELIHRELQAVRHKIITCRVCGRSHNEWFRASTADVVAILDAWASISVKSPVYAPNGLLNSWWYYQVLPNVREPHTVAALVRANNEAIERHEARERAQELAVEQARRDAETAEYARREALERAQRDAAERARRDAEAAENARRAAEDNARREATERARREAAERARRDIEAAENARRAAAAAQAQREEAEARFRRMHEALERARLDEELQARREADARAQREERLRREAAARLSRENEERTRKEAVEKTRREAEEKKRREDEEQARREAEEAAADADAQAKSWREREARLRSTLAKSARAKFDEVLHRDIDESVRSEVEGLAQRDVDSIIDKTAEQLMSITRSLVKKFIRIKVEELLGESATEDVVKRIRHETERLPPRFLDEFIPVTIDGEFCRHVEQAVHRGVEDVIQLAAAKVRDGKAEEASPANLSDQKSAENEKADPDGRQVFANFTTSKALGATLQAAAVAASQTEPPSLPASNPAIVQLLPDKSAAAAAENDVIARMRAVSLGKLATAGVVQVSSVDRDGDDEDDDVVQVQADGVDSDGDDVVERMRVVSLGPPPATAGVVRVGNHDRPASVAAAATATAAPRRPWYRRLAKRSAR